MSLNQSRSDKNDSQYRKAGGSRSGGSSQHRAFSGGSGRGGGGGTAPPLSTNSSSLSSNRSFKKTNNVHGGPARPNAGYVNTSESTTAPPAAARSTTQNGSHAHPQQTLCDSVPSAVPKPSDASTAHKGNRPIPKAPSSQSSAQNSGSNPPATPVKAPGDPSKGFPPLQFGSISPGFMNGMQVPARTSSAPPNLDEQKREQARHEALRAQAAAPITSIPKQQLPKKDIPSVEQQRNGGSYGDTRAKRDVQIKPAAHQPQSQKSSVVPVSGISVPIPFHQPPVPMQFSGPNPQIQSQPMLPSSIQMQMHPPVQQQVFVSGLQHHMMQPQGMMPQGQSLGFNPQIGPHLPHQMGSMGMNMPTHYSPQQAGKFVSGRKTVKITHPDTHEELRLDKRTDPHADGVSTASRTHHNAAPQQVHSYASTHPSSYYANSYSAGLPFFPTPIPQLPSGSQPPRFSYPVNQGVQAVSFMDQSAPSAVVTSSKGGSLSHVSSEVYRLDQTKEAPAASTSMSVIIKPAPVSTERATESKVIDNLEPPIESRPAAQTDSTYSSKDPKPKVDEPQVAPKSGANFSKHYPEKLPETAPAEPVPAMGSGDGRRRETVTRSESGKETLSKPGKKVNSQPAQQVSGTPAPDSDDSLKKQNTEYPEVKAQSSRDVNQELVSSVSAAISDVSCSGSAGAPESGTSLDSDISRAEAEKISVDLSKSSTEGSENVSSSLKAAPADQDIGVKEGHGLGVVATIQRETQSSLSHLELFPSVAHGSDATCGSVVGRDDNSQNDILKSGVPHIEVVSNAEDPSEASSKPEEEVIDNAKSSLSSTPVPDSGKSSAELNKNKNAEARGKKKRKEILQKADAAGTTSDLYMAYKGPEDKQDAIGNADDSVLSTNQKGSALHESFTSKEQVHPGKVEPDDWEDAADISAPKLASGDADGKTMHIGEEGITAKKYSRDFLLTFAEQCRDLPQGFVVSPDEAKVLVCSHVNDARVDSEHPSPGRIVDRASGGNRGRGNGTMDHYRRGKGPVPVGIEPNHANMEFRTGHGGNFGLLRNPHAGPAHTPGPGGILPGPMQSRGVQRTNANADSWRRPNFDKPLMLPPHTPMQVMHKAERKYEVGKVEDEEQAKQRRLKGILNKLTPQNFDKLFEQVKAVNIDNAVTLSGVISQIFDKALMEPTFCEMYANFCFYLSSELPDLSVDNQKITFKRLLLNKCQEEFERGKREEEEANKLEGEGETKQSDEEREEKRVNARRRMLGNIRLIGELYKKRMLTERIMHECIKQMLGQYQNPDEEDVEALCKLMSTIGEMIDHPKAKDYMDAYFDIMSKLSNNMKLSSRVRFMLKDAIDLRRNKWQQRRKVEGPKKIEEVHRDAAQERHAQTNRLTRGPSMNSSMRRGQPVDFGPRGSSMLSSPVGQMGSYRGLSPQVRGFGGQDARIDERSAFENRTLSVLPQRPLGDDSITLGPQGGLARGMSMRGHPSVSSTDISSSHLEARRMLGGLNGYSAVPERPAFNSREDLMPRFTLERFGGPPTFDQSRSHEVSSSFVSRDQRSFDRPRPSSPAVQGLSPSQNASSEKSVAEKVFSDERLQDMSIAAIEEFYSAKDEKEVALCLRDLNAPSFYPTVVSIWVSDSFEGREEERDLLNKLLINLSRPQDGIFSRSQLVEGFASVLTTLEEMVTDAPKAPEFLGRLFGKAVLENVISLEEIGHLLHEGEEEPGCLREGGLAGDVLGCTLESIKSEKGEAALNEIRANSNLRLEDFRPPDPLKSRKLESFI